MSTSSLFVFDNGRVGSVLTRFVQVENIFSFGSSVRSFIASLLCSSILPAIRCLSAGTNRTPLRIRDSAMLVRGEDKYGNFDHEPPPSADLSEAALLAHKDATERQLKTYYKGTSKEEFRP